MNRRIATLALIVAVLFGSTGVVSASSDESSSVEAQINNIYQERAALLAEQTDGYLQEYDRLGKELKSLGVEFLTPEEAKAEIKEKSSLRGSIQPQVVVPTSSNIVWSSFRAVYTYNGVSYEVQHLTAESNSQNSVLKGTGVTAVQSSNSLQAGITNFAVTAAKTTLGTFNAYAGIAISVYDAINAFISDSNFDKTTTITNISASYTWNYYESVDFMYVKKALADDSAQSLALVTSSVNGSYAWSIPTFTYNSTTGATTDATIHQGTPKTFSYIPQYNRDGAAAITYYLSGPTAYSQITQIILTGISDKTVKTIYPVTPTFPSSIM